MKWSEKKGTKQIKITETVCKFFLQILLLLLQRFCMLIKLRIKPSNQVPRKNVG